MLRRSTFLFVLFILSTHSQAQIQEISRMNEILPYVTEGAWVVFDLDNTIIEPSQTLGSDQWYQYLLTRTPTREVALGIWSAVQEKTSVSAVESETPGLISQIQRMGNRVFALTARPDTLRAATLEQLRSLGVAIDPVIMIGPGVSKGTAILQEISRAGVTPSRILFTDDKVSHVNEVNESLTGTGIENYEFRYGAADPHVRDFNANVSEIELGYFEFSGNLISDQEANEKLQMVRSEAVQMNPETAITQRALEDLLYIDPTGVIQSCSELMGRSRLVRKFECVGTIEFGSDDGTEFFPYEWHGFYLTIQNPGTDRYMILR